MVSKRTKIALKDQGIPVQKAREVKGGDKPKAAPKLCEACCKGVHYPTVVIE